MYFCLGWVEILMTPLEVVGSFYKYKHWGSSLVKKLKCWIILVYEMIPGHSAQMPNLTRFRQTLLLFDHLISRKKVWCKKKKHVLLTSCKIYSILKSFWKININRVDKLPLAAWTKLHSNDKFQTTRSVSIALAPQVDSW